MSREFNFVATGIGSLPLTDPEQAVALALRYLPEAPFWPQLPLRGPLEHMDWQYAEGLPGLVEDRERPRLFLDSSRDLSAGLERFYERFLAGDDTFFAISEERAPGFHSFVRALRRGPPAGARYLKGQITGPLTAGLMFKDGEGRDVIYDETLYDALVKLLAMKAAWQIERLREFALPVIVFLDEPAMESLGSAFCAAPPELVAEKLDEIVAVIHGRGGLAGIHCCGNADWGLIFRTQVDIVNFDAFDYLERVLLYPQEIRSFFERGGALAWGIVPTAETAGPQSVPGLAARVEAGIARLEAAGIGRDTLRRASLVTPSCGLGSLDPRRAEEILSQTREVASLLQSRSRA